MNSNWVMAFNEIDPIYWLVWQQEQRRASNLPWATKLHNLDGTVNKAAIIVQRRR